MIIKNTEFFSYHICKSKTLLFYVKTRKIFLSTFCDNAVYIKSFDSSVYLKGNNIQWNT